MVCVAPSNVKPAHAVAGAVLQPKNVVKLLKPQKMRNESRTVLAVLTAISVPNLPSVESPVNPNATPAGVTEPPLPPQATRQLEARPTIARSFYGSNFIVSGKDLGSKVLGSKVLFRIYLGITIEPLTVKVSMPPALTQLALVMVTVCVAASNVTAVQAVARLPPQPKKLMTLPAS